MRNQSFEISSDALELLETLVSRSKRKTGVPFSSAFICRRTPEDASPPLARLLRGRGGSLRLKLYITFCLLGVGKPHDVFGAPYIWAKALALPESTTSGARTVRQATKWLEARRLVKMGKRKTGEYPKVFLRSQSGNGRAYARPKESGERYARLPTEFWEKGWILKLTGTGIAVLLVLLRLQYGKEANEAPWVKAAWQYDLSPDTWTRGTEELVRIGILKKKNVVTGDEQAWRRRRNVYWVRLNRLEKYPPE